MNKDKQINNDPIILMELLKILNTNKDKKWITIPTLADMINDKGQRVIIKSEELRQMFLPELQQSKDVQINYGIVVSSTRGIMMTNDREVIDRFIVVEEARAKTIFRKLKIVKEARERISREENYGIEDIFNNPNPKLYVYDGDASGKLTINPEMMNAINSSRTNIKTPNVVIDIIKNFHRENEILEEQAKEYFTNNYWEDEWNGDDDYTEEKEQLWDFDTELREEWIKKYEEI